MRTSVDLHYERIGGGRPLVILHGLFGSARNWQSIARQMSDEYDVVTVDMRNHGASPHAPGMNYMDLAEDVGRLLEKLDLREVRLLGHSMGGKAAMTLALNRPERIERLIIVDIAPDAYPNEYGEMLDRMLALDPGSVASRRDADSWLKPAVPEDDVRLFLLQNLRFDANRVPKWRLNLHAIRDAIDDLVGAIPCPPDARFQGPAWFIRGADSARINDAHPNSIDRHFPDANLVAIAGAGHWPHAEKPTEFLSVLRRSLQP